MERNKAPNRDDLSRAAGDLTGIEALFAEAGLPAVEVAACPVAGCEVCNTVMPAAA